MDGNYTFWKRRGETLAVALRRFKDENGIPEGVSVTYAGRLDPLAEGELIFLVGEAVHHKAAYIRRSKTYRVTVLAGFGTDTYDLLGIPKEYRGELPEIEKELQRYQLPYTFSQAYPPYASKTVNGVPLFVYAREGKQVEAPVHTVTLHHISMLGTHTVSGEALNADVETLLDTVTGDFRQEEIRKAWKQVINPATVYTLYELELTVSSGFYVRTFIHDLGVSLGVPLCIHTLQRTAILP